MRFWLAACGIKSLCRSRGACFESQKRRFRVKAAGKTGKRPIRTDNAMTRNYNR